MLTRRTPLARSTKQMKPAMKRGKPLVQRAFPVTDPELDAPDGAVVDGFVRSGDQWQPLKRTGGLKRSRIKAKRRRAREGDDPAHLAWLREQACCVCGTTRNVEAHHPRLPGTGMARKAPDREAFPMCHLHHVVEFHGARGFFDGWSKPERHRWQREMSGKYAAGGQTV